jgi:hypothetical protein
LKATLFLTTTVLKLEHLLFPVRFNKFSFVGIPLKWSTSGFIKPGTPPSANPIPPEIVHHVASIGELKDKAVAAGSRLLDGDQIQLLRLRTRTNEVIIAPGEDCTLVVLQKAHSAAMTPLVAADTTPSAAPPVEDVKAASPRAPPT